VTAGRKLNTQSQDWGTPENYVEAVREFFDGRISLDPCSNKYSIVKAETEYQLPDNDGLRDSWNFPSIYVNPPYGIDRKRGTSIKKWFLRCSMANEQFNSEVLALVPVATNTTHWKNFVFGKASAVCFLYDTRLRFLVNGQTGGKGAPMACAMVYWGKKFSKFLEVFKKHGAVLDLRKLRSERFDQGIEKGGVGFLIDQGKRDLFDKTINF